MFCRIRLDEFDAVHLMSLAAEQARVMAARAAAEADAIDGVPLRVQAEYYRRLAERLAVDIHRHFYPELSLSGSNGSALGNAAAGLAGVDFADV